MSMCPSKIDLEVWSDYQIGELRRVRQQTSLPPPPSRLRIALARALVAVTNRLSQPVPDAPSPKPLTQPS